MQSNKTGRNTKPQSRITAIPNNTVVLTSGIRGTATYVIGDMEIESVVAAEWREQWELTEVEG